MNQHTRMDSQAQAALSIHTLDDEAKINLPTNSQHKQRLVKDYHKYYSMLPSNALEITNMDKYSSAKSWVVTNPITSFESITEIG